MLMNTILVPTPIESRINFFAPAPVSPKVLARCVPLHRCWRTILWQPRIESESGRLLPIVTQTQTVLGATQVSRISRTDSSK